MRTTLLRLSLTVLLVAATVALPASQQSADVPAKLPAAFSALESELRKTLDVTPALTPGRDDLALLMQKSPRAARSWQLNPALAREMTADELFQFVTRRANLVLTCAASYLSEWSLQEPAGGSPGARQAAPPNQAARMWEGPPEESTMRLTPDCVQLVDADDQPVTVSTRADLAAFDRLMTRFRPPAAAARRAQAASSPRLTENLAYLRREYGRTPALEPDIEAVLGRDGTRVFSRQVLTFLAYFRVTGDEFRLILLVPLTA